MQFKGVPKSCQADVEWFGASQRKVYAIQTLRQQFREIWHNYFWLRWAIIHMVMWQLALLMAAFLWWVLGGWGVLMSGAAVGAIIGVGQSWLLFTPDEQPLRYRWVSFSGIGGFLGMFPAGILALVGVFQLTLAAFLVGAAFAGVLGILQALILASLLDDRAYLWVPMSAFAGGLALVCLVPLVRWGVPLCLSPGFLLFGLFTGGLLSRWLDADDKM